MSFGQLPYDVAHVLGGAMLLLSCMLLYQRRVAAVITALALQGGVLAAAAAWQGYVQGAPQLFLTALMALLAKAATAAGSFERSALTSALAGISGWAGWTGKVSFDASTGNRIPAPVVVATTSADGTLHIDPSWVTATGFTV